uniref:uncharacterized protein n=1 Tax=Myxine glutinosa TaxID=7769 RepID=UPI00358E11DE
MGRSIKYVTKVERLAARANQKRQARAKEHPDQRKKTLKQMSQYFQARIASESSEEREARLKQRAQAARVRRTIETPTTRSVRLTQNAQQKRDLRANETPDERNARIASRKRKSSALNQRFAKHDVSAFGEKQVLAELQPPPKTMDQTTALRDLGSSLSWLEIQALSEESLRAVVTGLGIEIFGALCARAEPAPVRDRLCSLVTQKFNYPMYAELYHFMETCEAGRGLERTVVAGHGNYAAETLGPALRLTVQTILRPSAPVGPALEPIGGAALGPTFGSTVGPVLESTVGPSLGPTVGPALGPFGWPALGPTVRAALVQTVGPALEPTVGPALEPTVGPALEPAVGLTGVRHALEPTVGPTLGLNGGPALRPTVGPEMGPTVGPEMWPRVGPALRLVLGPRVVPALGPFGWPALGLTVGPALGPTVGPALGPTVGPALGPTVGPALGQTVGPALGQTVGPALGQTVGPALGQTVGPALGQTVGPALGQTVGPALGQTVGPALGPALRPTVGPVLLPTVRPALGPTVKPALGTTVGPALWPTGGPSLGSTGGPSLGSTAGAALRPTGGPALGPTVTYMDLTVGHVGVLSIKIKEEDSFGSDGRDQEDVLTNTAFTHCPHLLGTLLVTHAVSTLLLCLCIYTPWGHLSPREPRSYPTFLPGNDFSALGEPGLRLRGRPNEYKLTRMNEPFEYPASEWRPVQDCAKSPRNCYGSPKHLEMQKGVLIIVITGMRYSEADDDHPCREPF